jgi:hypothetical protein
MRDWLAEAVDYLSEEKQKSKTAQISTDKTDKTPPRIVSSVLSVPLEAISGKRDPSPEGVSSVLSVPLEAISGKRDPSPEGVSSVLSVPLEAISGKTLPSLLHPEDARDLAEAVSYLRGATREEAIEAGKEAARDPSEVPLSDYEATLDECGLAYWWCGDRYHVQGGYIREWFKQSRTPSRRWGK